MTVNYDDWEVIPMAIGTVVLLLIFGIIYVALLSGLTYLLLAGIAYVFDATLPTELPYILVGYAVLSALWKFYKEVKS